jgi:hypothetical protein
MSNNLFLNRLEKWITNVSVYPPAELYFQAPKSQEKKEKRCKEICEALYKFNWEGAKYPNPIGTVREIVREMCVLDRMFEYNPFPPKYENIVKLVAKFVNNADNLVAALDKMHGQNERMKDWYDHWKVGQLRIQLLSYRWGADILRLGDDDKVTTKFIDDVEQAQKEMK